MAGWSGKALFPTGCIEFQHVLSLHVFRLWQNAPRKRAGLIIGHNCTWVFCMLRHLQRLCVRGAITTFVYKLRTRMHGRWAHVALCHAGYEAAARNAKRRKKFEVRILCLRHGAYKFWPLWSKTWRSPCLRRARHVHWCTSMYIDVQGWHVLARGYYTYTYRL